MAERFQKMQCSPYLTAWVMAASRCTAFARRCNLGRGVHGLSRRRSRGGTCTEIQVRDHCRLPPPILLPVRQSALVWVTAPKRPCRTMRRLICVALASKAKFPFAPYVAGSYLTPAAHFLLLVSSRMRMCDRRSPRRHRYFGFACSTFRFRHTQTPPSRVPERLFREQSRNLRPCLLSSRQPLRSRPTSCVDVKNQ